VQFSGDRFCFLVRLTNVVVLENPPRDVRKTGTRKTTTTTTTTTTKMAKRKGRGGVVCVFCGEKRQKEKGGWTWYGGRRSLVSEG
jgi:hypothetical protein